MESIHELIYRRTPTGNKLLLINNNNKKPGKQFQQTDLQGNETRRSQARKSVRRERGPLCSLFYEFISSHGRL